MVMPKRVDHHARRASLARMAIETIDAVGLDTARLTDVAARAAASTTAITHYFPNKDALLEAALAAIADRTIANQTEQMAEIPGSVAAAVAAAAAFLPVDAESAREWRVWLAFCGRAVANPRFAAQHRDYYLRVAAPLAAMFAALPHRDGSEVHAGACADAFIAAIDGIALRATLEPDDWPAARQRATLALLLTPLLEQFDFAREEMLS